MHDQKMVEQKSPEVWSKLLQKFKAKCEEFNKEAGIGNVLGFHEIDSHTFRIVRNDIAAISLKVNFFDPFKTIKLEGIKTPANFRFGVINGTSEVGLFYDVIEPGRPPGELMSLDDIATMAINELLEIV